MIGIIIFTYAILWVSHYRINRVNTAIISRIKGKCKTLVLETKSFSNKILSVLLGINKKNSEMVNITFYSTKIIFILGCLFPLWFLIAYLKKFYTNPLFAEYHFLAVVIIAILLIFPSSFVEDIYALKEKKRKKLSKKQSRNGVR